MAANYNQQEQSFRLDIIVRLLVSLLLFAAVLGLIFVQVASAETGGGTTLRYHTVQSGDSLRRIAVVYATSPEAIIEANDLVYPYGLSVGELLLIPDGSIPSQSPHEALARFYDWYLPAIQDGKRPLTSGLYQASPLLSDAFKQRIDETLVDSNGLADPLLCGGEADVLPVVTAEQTVSEEKSAFFGVRFGDRAFSVTMSRVSDRWQVDRVECGAD